MNADPPTNAGLSNAQSVSTSASALGKPLYPYRETDLAEKLGRPIAAVRRLRKERLFPTEWVFLQGSIHITQAGAETICNALGTPLPSTSRPVAVQPPASTLKPIARLTVTKLPPGPLTVVCKLGDIQGLYCFVRNHVGFYPGLVIMARHRNDKFYDYAGSYPPKNLPPQ
jgi:hypothetical protein